MNAGQFRVIATALLAITSYGVTIAQEVTFDKLLAISQRQFSELVRRERSQASTAESSDKRRVSGIEEQFEAAKDEMESHLRAARSGKVVRNLDELLETPKTLWPVGIDFAPGVSLSLKDGKPLYLFGSNDEKVAYVVTIRDSLAELTSVSRQLRKKGGAELVKESNPDLWEDVTERFAPQTRNQVEANRAFYYAFEDSREHLEADKIGMFVESFRVIQIVGPYEMLILHHRFQEAPMRIIGYPTEGIEDSAGFREPLLVAGKRPYDARDGVTRNIWVLQRIQPETVRRIQASLVAP